MDDQNTRPEGEDRREFLRKCGRFAAVTPPAITMLLSTSLTSSAIADSVKGGPRDMSYSGKKSGWVGGPGRSTTSNRGGKK